MGVYFVSKKLGVPYTVLLVIAGILLVPISDLPFFGFLSSFNLTTDLLFFVFLPILIFESAYNMNFKEAWENKLTISALAVVGLMISALIIAFVGTWMMKLAGVEVPFMAMLLFGTIISATDPVAVLALFKEFGAPKRLTMLFEGESLFNDASAFAVFIILLEVMRNGESLTGSLLPGFVTFLVMIIGGVLFGGFIGVLFSKILEKIKDNEKVEITLTMVVAHITFIFAELISANLLIGGQQVHVSSIIATVVASMVIGNYGRYKISPRVEEYMDKFWEYFAFVANSLVFIMMGSLFAKLFQSQPQFLAPIFVSIVIVTIARIISVYVVTTPLNLLNVEDKIPNSWKKILAFGDLKGALAVIMLLFIPVDLQVDGWNYSYSLKDFLTVITVGCIFFTLFAKAPFLGFLMNKLGINDLTEVEKLEFEEGKVLMLSKVMSKLEVFNSKGYIGDEVYNMLKDKYDKEFKHAKKTCGKLAGNSKKTFEAMLRLYAIGIEKHSLKRLFKYDEVDEVVFKKLYSKLNWQEECVEKGILEVASADAAEDFKDDKGVQKVIGKACEISRHMSFWERKTYAFYDKKIKNSDSTSFMYYRALQIISRKVVKELMVIQELSTEHQLGNRESFEKVIGIYNKFKDVSQAKMEQVFDKLQKEKKGVKQLEERFAMKGVQMIEEKVIHELSEKGMITNKVAFLLREEFLDE
jgi:CPA1 family monovalent cation:H+ antiporter